MHSKTLHPCSSNQCDTARLESKLTSIQIMFISFLEFVHWFSNDAQRLVYEKQRSRTLLTVIDMRSVPDCSKEHSPSIRPLISVALHFFPQLSILYILVSLTFLLTLHIFLTMMMMIDHDAFLPAVVMTSYTPCCMHTNISRQYNGTHYKDNDNTTQHNWAGTLVHAQFTTRHYITRW